VSDPIRLDEYRDADVELVSADADFVEAELSKKISIRRSLHGDRYVLNPSQYVGVVALPSGRRLESYPKVPVRNLFHMLAVAFELESPFRDEATQLERLDELLEFVVAHFANLVEARVDHGLYRDYVEVEENLGTVRGRISIAEDLRRNHVTRHRTYCRFTEFTWDVPENQVVRQVVHRLAGWGMRPVLQQRLRSLDGVLGEVRPTALPVSALDRIRYHRLNEDYRPIHQLCRLFLEGASLSEQEGVLDFRTFLVDMNRLFEAFVTQLLRERAPATVTVDRQVLVHLGQNKAIRMFPDILLGRRARPTLVADCKYKRLSTTDTHGHDVYQMLAYCTAARVRRGVLIYPAHASVAQDEVAVRHTDVRISRMAIDLGREGPELVAECDDFATRLFESVEPEESAF